MSLTVIAINPQLAIGQLTKCNVSHNLAALICVSNVMEWNDAVNRQRSSFACINIAALSNLVVLVVIKVN